MVTDRIYLLGFMGAGKSSLGRNLAKELGYRFIDLDRAIESNEKMSIPELFSNFGEKYFRVIESKVLREVSQNEQIVISLGGGTPINPENFNIISKNVTIYIKLPPKALFQRLIVSKNPRPLIQGFSKEELLNFIELKLKEREPIYKQAMITIDGHKINIATIVKVINSIK